MKSKRFKIKVMSFDQAGSDFIHAWNSARRGKVSEPEYDLILGLPDISWLTKIFSPERIRLIQAVKTKNPKSLRQLSVLLGRAQQNVQKEVGKKRESLQPLYKWDGFDIAV